MDNINEELKLKILDEYAKSISYTNWQHYQKVIESKYPDTDWLIESAKHEDYRMKAMLEIAIKIIKGDDE